MSCRGSVNESDAYLQIMAERFRASKYKGLEENRSASVGKDPWSIGRFPRFPWILISSLTPYRFARNARSLLAVSPGITV